MSQIAEQLQKESLKNLARLSPKEKIFLALELSEMCFGLSEQLNKKSYAKSKAGPKKNRKNPRKS